ncbi:MAG TPA: RagB/SusD family nutrient uptake outer membrane protein, partial [Anseongella sp.]|nr:RagB/SusD family nutrient uptake outer membrane protein [Anseongella sp.]
MKQYLYIGGLVVAAGLGACSGKLDLDPGQSIDAENALSSDRDFESAITGAYALIGDNTLYGTDLNLVPELLASEDYCIWRGSFTNYRDISAKSMNSGLITAESTWLQAYQAINIANNVLANIAKVQDEDLRRSLEGEAMFLRGILHFELVRLYALPYEAGRENAQ